LNVKEFWEYCLKVEYLIAELGGEIPEDEKKIIRNAI